jgi:peptidoglycan/LPS O-acetylase OafA/YrhL
LPDLAPAALPAFSLAIHFPALDGLRGIAILMVLFFHMTLLAPMTAPDHILSAVVANGSLGVDLFFVLSGFLITGILLDAKGTPHYLRNFYARRILRIFPLYYAIIAIYLVILPRFAPEFAARFGHIEGRPILYWLFFSNHAVAPGAAEGLDFRFGVLNPTWSLAVEEQFYVFWPLLVLALSRQALTRLLPVVVAAVVGLRIILVARHWQWGYLATLTPCRLDALAIGGFVACLARSQGGRAALIRVAKPAACAAILGLVAVRLQRRFGFEHGELRYSVGFTCIALLAAAVLVGALTLPPAHPVARTLRSRVLVAFGKYSYAIYLLHMPIQALLATYVYPMHRFARLGSSTLPGQFLFYALSLVVFFAAGWLSWHGLEKHFLRLKSRFPMPHAR